MSIASAQGKKHLLLYSESVFFNSGSNKIWPRFKGTLEEAASLLNKTKDAKAWIQAHTDSLGSYQSNQSLSDRRASAVYSALIEMGVDSSQLQLDSHGEYVPLQSNGTATGRALNRRVSIEVVRPYIFVVKVEPVCIIKGKVIDAKTGKPLETRLIFNSLVVKDSIDTDENGRYEYRTDLETAIEVRAHTKGYFFVSKLTETHDQETIQLDFTLEPAIIGGKMALNDLFFKSGTPLLMNASEQALDGVVSFMKFNSTLRIEVGGHINRPNQAPVPEGSSSFKLSEARAVLVYKYLIENGISEERLLYKGYGNSEMIHPRANTPIQEQLNRRVELKVIE
jgi:outer membrane protein OmpA-like peptidoglycan-associated protein